MIEATKYSTTHVYVIAQSWKNKNKLENFSEILEINIYSYPRIAEYKMELKPTVLKYKTIFHVHRILFTRETG